MGRCQGILYTLWGLRPAIGHLHHLLRVPEPASPRPPTTEPARIDPNPMAYRIRRANGSLQAALSQSPPEKGYKKCSCVTVVLLRGTEGCRGIQGPLRAPKPNPTFGWLPTSLDLRTSEIKCSANLYFACVVLSAADLAKGVRCDAAVRTCELGMVPCVEEFSAEGEFHFPIDSEAFMHAHIPVVDAGPVHAVKARCSESSSRASWHFAVDKVHRIDGRVDITGASRLCLTHGLALEPVMAVRAHVLVGQHISAVAICVYTDLSGRPGGVVWRSQRERVSLLHRSDGVDIPAANHEIEKGVHLISKLPATP
jgi:hypothetical protein